MGIPDLKPIVAAINRMADGLHRLAAAQEEANRTEQGRKMSAMANQETKQLEELLKLHLAYEDTAIPEDEWPGSSEAAELSMAVGRYLRERGFSKARV